MKCLLIALSILALNFSLTIGAYGQETTTSDTTTSPETAVKEEAASTTEETKATDTASEEKGAGPSSATEESSGTGWILRQRSERPSMEPPDASDAW